MIAQIDDQFARLLKALDDSGQRDNTLIVFSSDHGEALGDHGLIFKGCRFYEGLVRVPLIFNWPGVVKQNIQVGGLVELLDMSATILDFAGLKVPEYFQGNSLRPILEGNESGEHIRDSVRCEYFDAVGAYFTDGNGTFATMYRRGYYKLSVYHGLNLGELYDLENDPWEHDNLWDSANHQQLKFELLAESFDQHVLLTTDVGSRRIAPM